MRSAVSILSPFVLAAILLFAPVVAVFGEDLPEANVRREVNLEWRSLAKGRTEFDVSDPALLPSRLALAAKQSACRYKDDITKVPVHFFNGKEQRFALVFCFAISGGSHQVFDLSDLRKPQLVDLPFIAQQGWFYHDKLAGRDHMEKRGRILSGRNGIGHAAEPAASPDLSARHNPGASHLRDYSR